MPGHGHQDPIRIARIDGNLWNLLAITKSQMRPGFPCVARPVDTVADRQIGTLQTFTAANINDVWIGGRDGNRTHRASRLIVEDGRPGAAIVSCFPDPAIDLCHIKNIWLLRNAGYRTHTTTEKRADVAPLKRLEEIGIELLRDGRRTGRHQKHKSERRRDSASL